MAESSEPSGEGAPAPASRARAAADGGDYLLAVRLARAMVGEDAAEGGAVLEAAGVDPVALWTGAVLVAIIVLYWVVVR